MLRTLEEVIDCVRRLHRDHPGMLHKPIAVEMEAEDPLQLIDARVVDMDIKNGQVVLIVGEMK